MDVVIAENGPLKNKLDTVCTTLQARTEHLKDIVDKVDNLEMERNVTAAKIDDLIEKLKAPDQAEMVLNQTMKVAETERFSMAAASNQKLTVLRDTLKERENQLLGKTSGSIAPSGRSRSSAAV